MDKEDNTNKLIRMLLVDDSPGFIKSAAGFLAVESSLEIVGTARSGEEALQQVDRLHPDVVLMDIAMPGMGGLEATRRLKGRSDAPCIIVLTLHDTPEYRTRAATEGADGFIAKSDFGAQLLPLIHEVFGLQ